MSLPEPFSASTEAAGYGDIWLKWRSVRQQIAAGERIVAACREDLQHCRSAGALRFIAMTEEAKAKSGLALVGTVNRAVNLALRPMSDLAQYGVEDFWAAPLDSLARAAGDCEDYAIAKYAILRATGLAEGDLRLVVVHDRRIDQDHAVLAVRFAGEWRILDNRRMLMLRDRQLADYEPLFILDDGVKKVRGTGPEGFALASGPAPSAILDDATADGPARWTRTIPAGL